MTNALKLLKPCLVGFFVSVSSLPYALAKEWSFGGWVGYDFTRELRFSNARFASGSGTDDSSILKYKLEGVPSAGLEVMYGAQNAWGFNAGLAFDLPRKIKTYELDSSVGGASGDVTGDATLSTSTFYVDVFHRWTSLYLSVGAIWTAASSSSAPIPLNNVSGQPGFQLGGGWFFNDHFAIEGMYRMIDLGVKEGSAFGGTIEGRKGSLNGALVSLKGYL